jgi:hypothetical protein
MSKALMAGIIIVSGAGVVAKQLPEIRRYLRIESM